ncbi:MAG TPA: GNAT family N-acetyltransferase [Pilimelia sp.]|nr:GNAT family N-acetyltransferase [Pilimelia sp.]
MGAFLETDRLVLRRFTAADEDDVFALDNDPEVMRYLTGGEAVPPERIRNVTLPRLMDPARRFWAADERATGRFVGWFALNPTGTPGEADLGYRLRRAAWGRGYATEGARALVRVAFADLGLRRVVATTMAVNAASRRVMEKAGLAYVRTFHVDFDNPLPGTELGEVEYALDAPPVRQGMVSA